jgi:hypothetical protein
MAGASEIQIRTLPKRRFFAVLHVPPITGPREAVQAAIVAETRAK